MIIDTSVVIAVTERRSPTAITAIGALGNKSIRSFVVEAELIAGLEAARRSQMDPADITMRESTLNTYYDLSERPVSLPLDVLAAAFGQVTGACSSHHLRLGQNDRWILAEALSLDVIGSVQSWLRYRRV